MKKALPPTPILYLITDRRQFATSDAWERQLQLIALAAQAGCQYIQIREKDVSARELYQMVESAIAVARPHGAKIFVNDRVDIALATDADGVHLRTDSLTVSHVKKLTKNHHLLIGVSTHSVNDAQLVAAQGADFIVTGPIFETPSKLAYGKPFGLDGLAAVCAAVKIPVLALGGISANNFSQPLNTGAAGIAGIGIFNNSQTLVSNIKMMLSFQREPQDSV